MFYGELSWMKGGRHREKVPIEYRYDIGQEKKERGTQETIYLVWTWSLCCGLFLFCLRKQELHLLTIFKYIKLYFVLNTGLT